MPSCCLSIAEGWRSKARQHQIENRPVKVVAVSVNFEVVEGFQSAENVAPPDYANNPSEIHFEIHAPPRRRIASASIASPI